jgi:BirA family biotin operon repressor/biotin-[acetyl-CoA-carboxylase] ligase
VLDRIDPLVILPELRTESFGWMCHWYDKIDSTNRVAFDRGLAGGGEGEVFLAEAQSKGRGRLGRSWFSPPHLNVYLSLILRPEIAPEEAIGINLIVGVTVTRVLQKLYQITALIKWPNDVLVNGRKLAGILSEMHTTGKGVEFVILGVGVNLNVPGYRMPETIRGKTTSVLIETRKRCDRGEFVREFLASVEKAYHLFLTRGLSPFLPFLQKRSWLTGREVEIESCGAVVRGIARGISSDGSLLLGNARGQWEEIRSGTIRTVGD